MIGYMHRGVWFILPLFGVEYEQQNAGDNLSKLGLIVMRFSKFKSDKIICLKSFQLFHLQILYSTRVYCLIWKPMSQLNFAHIRRTIELNMKFSKFYIKLMYHMGDHYFQGADKMNHFLERMNRDSEEFYLEENLQIYGRDEQLKHVYDLLFSHNSASKHCRFDRNLRILRL